MNNKNFSEKCARITLLDHKTNQKIQKTNWIVKAKTTKKQNLFLASKLPFSNIKFYVISLLITLLYLLVPNLHPNSVVYMIQLKMKQNACKCVVVVCDLCAIVVFAFLLFFLIYVVFCLFLLLFVANTPNSIYISRFISDCFWFLSQIHSTLHSTTDSSREKTQLQLINCFAHIYKT